MEMTENEVFKKLSAFCSAAERCRSEVVEKMQRWGLPYDLVERVADRLIAENFIDESRYCRAFINDKFRLEKWGKMKIRQALYLKKIPQQLFVPYLSELNEEEYLDVLRGVLRSKRKSVHGADERDRDIKLIRFAMSRGFELADIHRCMEVPEEFEAEE